MTLRTIGCAAAALAMLLAGCAPQATSTTGSAGAVAGTAGMVAPVAAPTAESRFKHLAWNASWAETCGFNIDYLKLRASYLAYEAANGAAPADMDKLGASLDKARSILLRVVATKPDLCDSARIERIRGSMARYVAHDFSPGEAV
jgi:fumarylacetoacetate (FAA) hydrolase family protein